MNFKPQGVTVRKRKYGLFVIDRVVQRQYLFRYGMQGYERFHLCLLAVDTDIPSALRIHPDVVGMQQLYIHIRQSRQAGEYESPSRQLQPVVIHRSGKYLLELIAADVSVLCLRFGFIFQLLTGIHSDYLLIDCQIQQAVQPSQTMVGLRCPEVLASFQICLIRFAEVLCNFFKQMSFLPDDTI